MEERERDGQNERVHVRETKESKMLVNIALSKITVKSKENDISLVCL